MSDKHHLLTLPMEIRCLIYSFIYLETRTVNFISPKPHYTKTALFISCRQLYQETLEYYYSQNTFSLPLRQRFAVSDWQNLPRHFHLVKVLHLDAHTFFWPLSARSAKLSNHEHKCRQRLRKYLTGILWVDPEVLAPNLKTLIFADRVPKGADSGKRWSMEASNERSEEIAGRCVRIFEELHIGVGRVVLNIE